MNSEHETDHMQALSLLLVYCHTSSYGQGCAIQLPVNISGVVFIFRKVLGAVKLRRNVTFLKRAKAEKNQSSQQNY